MELSSSRIVSLFGEDEDPNALEISPGDAVDEFVIYQAQGPSDDDKEDDDDTRTCRSHSQYA